MRVCVIGAGMSGLAVTRELLRLQVPVIVLEREQNIGGVWDLKRKDVLYKNLRTNLPSTVMFHPQVLIDVDET